MLEYYEKLAKEIVFKDGKPYWLAKPKHSRWPVDVPAGTIRSDGRRVIRTTIAGKGRLIRAHRLAWFMKHGTLPTLIDHKDRTPDNNDCLNLREATTSENAQNRKISVVSTTGITGVTRDRKGFRASITLKGDKLRKRFATLSKATAWRKEQEERLHPFRPAHEEKDSVENMVRDALTDERFYD